MTATMDNDSVDIKSGPFGLNLKGANAFSIALFLLILCLAGLTLFENSKRESEHEHIVCTLKLVLFMQTQPKGAPIEWERVPVDLYPCIPGFLYNRGAPR